MSQITRIERRVSEQNLENKGKEVSKRSRSSALVPAKKENFQLPERLQALLTDDFDNEEFQSKLELLKCRYKHAVKSELISFCYASTDAAGDAGLVAETNRSPEFVRTLMNIVEKDKEIADLAVNLVEEIDLMEKAKVTTAAASRGNEPEDPLFKAIWENHEKSRKQVAKFLEEERFDIYGEKDIGKQVNLPSATDDKDDEDEPPVWARTNFDKWIRKPAVAQTKPTPEKVTPTEQPSNGTGALSEAELREQEITAGMQNLLDRLGCADFVPADATYEQKLAIIQERLRNLKGQVHELRQTSSAPLTATAAESTTAVTGSSSE